jgi:hypothetical protein
MKLTTKSNGRVTLTDADFRAQGGEGRVYVKGALAYKIYDDPARTIPEAKLGELAALTAPNIVRPLDLLFDRRRPVGYTMRHVERAHPLCRLFPPAFRKRVGLGPDAMLALVERLREGICHVHANGILVVDLNEMNFLVSERFDDLYFIDVDSYQTPSFAATALMESVRDHHATAFSTGTDWFAFAVVSFQLFVGIHPYKGKHPSLKTLAERMKANVSVLDRDVRVPAACLSFDTIPRAYRDWYEAVLERGARVPPPAGAAAVAVSVPAPVRAPGCVARATSGRAFLVRVEAGRLMLRDAATGAEIDPSIAAEAVSSVDGRAYAKHGGGLFELVLFETPARVLVSPKRVANVHERATQLFDGVALQSLLGAWYASVLPRSGVCHQVRVAELDGYAVVEAGYSDRELVVTAARRGVYDRFRLRFDAAHRRYDLQVERDVETI